MDARLDAVLTRGFPKDDGTCAGCGIQPCPCSRIVLSGWECA